ncbi:FKBP-type peptidyl-prolyl cis-trans isomerase [Tenacibaculum sp. UWU-22]|uniref:FKBP-type peptidyl-prolyl cis-trans isomerase n=1 Tax=Tenacibaculum sp. UWU-22 TaxID=3234187 RepID=UPI0034DAC539
MKAIKILAVVVTTLSILSCGKQLKTKSSLGTEIDSASYALGLNMGSQLKINFKEIDKDLFVQGFFNGMDSTNMLIAEKDVRSVLAPFFQKRQQEQMKKMMEKREKEAEVKFADYKKENEKFLADNKTKEGVKTTASGLQYIVLKEGKGESPKATSTVKIHYKGTTIKGEEFDSTYKKNKPYELRANQFVKGFSEGLELMKPGAKYKFFIPQELAYGSQQRGALIKPFSTLIFEVELLEVKN